MARIIALLLLVFGCAQHNKSTCESSTVVDFGLFDTLAFNVRIAADSLNSIEFQDDFERLNKPFDVYSILNSCLDAQTLSYRDSILCGTLLFGASNLKDPYYMYHYLRLIPRSKIDSLSIILYSLFAARNGYPCSIWFNIDYFPQINAEDIECACLKSRTDYEASFLIGYVYLTGYKFGQAPMQHYHTIDTLTALDLIKYSTESSNYYYSEFYSRLLRQMGDSTYYYYTKRAESLREQYCIQPDYGPSE